MEYWLLIIIAIMAIIATSIIIVCCIRKYRQKISDDQEIFPECTGVCVTALKPNCQKDYATKRVLSSQEIDSSVDNKIIMTNEKLVDASKKEEESSLSSSSIKKTEDASKDDAVCNERSERPVENNFQLPVADNNKQVLIELTTINITNRDRQLLMFEAPPPYEESSSKTLSDTTRMVPMNGSQLDNTQNTNTSQCSTPDSGPSSVVNKAPAPQLNLPKRLISNSRSPNKFAGPRGETAAPVLLASTNSTETNVVFPPIPGTGKSPPANTITSMCRSEMDIGMNGEDAGRTPRVQSPITSGTGSLKTTNASTVVTFTPGSSTNEKEEK